ncbi:MAG: PIN domain-containing protein, partial [Candidatus Sungiibacteriota bacterium]
PFDGTRARKAGAVRRNIPSLKLPDAAIAALALEMNTPLVTRNVRDFKRITEIAIITL